MSPQWINSSTPRAANSRSAASMAATLSCVSLRMPIFIREPGLSPAAGRASTARPAILAATTSFLVLADTLRLDGSPELLMGDAAPGPKALSRGFQNRLKLGRMTQEQPFQILLVLGAEQDRDWPAIAHHDDGTRLGRLHVP